MRAACSDSLILEECWLPESAAVFCSDDMRPFRHAYLNWFWGSDTSVYLGVAQAAFDELRKVVHARHPEGYARVSFMPQSRSITRSETLSLTLAASATNAQPPQVRGL